MGSSVSSKQPPVNQNRQSNGNQFRNIDQSTGAAWLEFNWASFGGEGGISTIIVICVLLVALWVALRYNRKANKKARRAELHELLLLSSRHQRNHDYYKEHSSPHTRPSSGYPGMSSVLSPPVHVRERGYEGTPGSSPGSSSNTRCNVSSTQQSPLEFPPVSLPASLPPSQPCTSLPIGPAFGSFPGLPPGQGCRTPTSMSTSAVNLAMQPLPSQLLELPQQNNRSLSLSPGDWPTLPTPSRPSWRGWTQLLRSNYPVTHRRQFY